MRSITRGLWVSLAAALVAVAGAQNVNLIDNGSFATINAGTTGTPGLNDWHIGNGPNNVLQQVYAYRVGNGPVNVVNSIGSPVIDQPTQYMANIGYNDAANFVDFRFRYMLTGGGAFSSDLAEVTTIINRSQGTLNLTLFEYDYFTPGGNAGGTGTLLNSSTIRLANAGGMVTVGATNIPDRWMIDTGANVIAAILGGNLTNGNSPFTGNDVGFAFQWNVNIAQGQTWQMSKDKLLQPVPEPASLITLGGLAAYAIRRRRARQK